MQNNERRATLTLQLKKHKIITRKLNGGKIHIHSRAALRATHLLSDAREYLVQRMRIEIHHDQYSKNVFRRHQVRTRVCPSINAYLSCLESKHISITTAKETVG